VHAVIWNLGGLPNTINQCYSLPPPIGGACLFGSNEIIYLNQAVPPCGLSLNSDADEFTKFPFATETKSLCLTLDGCVVEILNESELLIATRSGELYILMLNVDISNAVKQLKIQKVYGKDLFVRHVIFLFLETNLPYTLTACYPGYIFLGSKLGDSLLLHYAKELQQENGTHADDATNEDQDVPMDEDDLFLYSSNKPAITKQVNFKYY
jgi:cleavage and polyadenylation specificity factor subunit 1